MEETKKEFILSNQLQLRVPWPGRLNMRKAKKYFIHKMTVALKEANETDDWLQVLRADEYISQKEFDSINADCDEIIRLTAVHF